MLKWAYPPLSMDTPTVELWVTCDIIKMSGHFES